MKLFAAFRHLL